MWLYAVFWESAGPGSNLRKCITLFPVLYTVNWFQFAERCVLWSSWCQISWEQCAEGSKSLYRISKLRNVGSYTGCFIAALKVYIEDLWNQVCRVIFHGIYFQSEGFYLSSLKFFQSEVLFPVWNLYSSTLFRILVVCKWGFWQIVYRLGGTVKSPYSICNVGFCLQNPLHYSVYIMWKIKFC